MKQAIPPSVTGKGAAYAGSVLELEGVKEILARGNSADRQLRILNACARRGLRRHPAANTTVVVRLLDPRWRVEIEADAIVTE